MAKKPTVADVIKATVQPAPARKKRNALPRKHELAVQWAYDRLTRGAGNLSRSVEAEIKLSIGEALRSRRRTR